MENRLLLNERARMSAAQEQAANNVPGSGSVDDLCRLPRGGECSTFARPALGHVGLMVSVLLLSACASGHRAPERRMGQDPDQYGSDDPEPQPIEDVPYDFEAEAVPPTGSASLEEKWWDAEKPCPEGSARHGGLPPEHDRVGCKTEKGKNVGRSTRFHPSGIKSEEGQFEDHFAVGVWTMWDDAGKKLSEAAYVAGKKEGWETIWYPGGGIKSQRPYREGVRDGVVTLWDEQGRKRTALTYVAGKEHGPEARWATDGVLSRVFHWVHGEKRE